MPSNEFLRSSEGSRELRKILTANFDKFTGSGDGIKLYAIDDVIACNAFDGRGITGRAMVMVGVPESNPLFAERQPDGSLYLYADFSLSSDMSKVAYFRHNLKAEAGTPAP